MGARSKKTRLNLSHIELPAMVTSWIIASEAQDHSDKTSASYRDAMRQFIHSIGHDDLLAVDRTQVRKWVIDLRDSGYAQSTQLTRFRIIRSFYSWCIREDELDVNPTDRVRSVRQPEDRTVKTLTTEQALALISLKGRDFQTVRDTAILTLMLDTGIRRMECINLQLSHVNLALGGIDIVKAKGQGRRRSIPIGNVSRVTMDRYVRARAKHRYADLPNLWLGLRGNLKYSALENVLKRHGERIGVPDLHPHALRHTWASQTRREGISEGDLMRLGGWRTRAMLDIYGAFDAEDRAQQAYRGHSFTDRLRNGG